MTGPLDRRTRALVGLSAALARDDARSLDARLEDAGREADPVEVEEILLQAYLFVGFPAVLAAFARWRALVPRPGHYEESSPEKIGRRGEALCRRVYGGAYEKLRRNVRALHPDLDRWMVEEGYGKVLARPVVDVLTRELCVVALLAAAGHERQLHSHLRGALHVGAAPEAVEAALRVGLDAREDSGDLARFIDIWSRVKASECSSTSSASG